MHLLLHLLGADSASSTAYLLWSGVVGDITVVFAIVAAPIVLYRKSNCEVRRCWRLARHDWIDPEHHVPHHLCRKHHPDQPDKQIRLAELRRVTGLYVGKQPGRG